MALLARAGADGGHGGGPGGDMSPRCRRRGDQGRRRLLPRLGSPGGAAGQASGDGAARPASLGPAECRRDRHARIALMVQACDATAGLIGMAPCACCRTPSRRARTGRPARCWTRRCGSRRWCGPAGAPPGWRSASTAAPGSARATSWCATSRRPTVTRPVPAAAPPARAGPRGLAFGSGLRPCPGCLRRPRRSRPTLSMRCGGCTFLPGQRVEYEQSSLRIPVRLEVALR